MTDQKARFQLPCPAGADCKLPSDCEDCLCFTCTRCERAVPWSEGAADDTPALCDDCAAWLNDEREYNIVLHDAGTEKGST